MKGGIYLSIYKIDRINLITYKCQKKKILKSVRCRYLAKSHIVNCNAKNQNFIYANFRGSIFKKVKFQNCKINGCDFWGTAFNDCDFRGAEISDCVFMACKFKNCNFSGATIKYTVIVNTSLAECQNIVFSEKTDVYKNYPKCALTEQLISALDILQSNRYLRTYKLLHISDKKYNELNLYLLQQRFSPKILPQLLTILANHSTKTITTYKKLERQLKCLENGAII